MLVCLLAGIKRLIGRRFDDDIVQQDKHHWPFDVINVEGKPMIQVMYGGEIRKFFPEEISSMVLMKMKEVAEYYLGKTVKNAVITVPAYFNNSQRQATKDAAMIAGLEVLRMINEPTAAALAYGLDKNKNGPKFVLIFDLGGGTFDVSLLSMSGGVFEVKSTAGDTHLGGEDFDNRLCDYFVKEFQRKFQKDLTTSKRSMQRLRFHCERAKRTLSTTTVANIEIEALYEGIDFFTSISRALFEELNKDLFISTLDPVKQVLQDAVIEKSQVQDVVLVGGSTRIPKVQRLLEDFFDGKALNRSINPDEAVAVGAAIQAAILDDDKSDIAQEVILLDVTSLSLGTETQGGIMTTVIKRNSRIPCKVSKEFHTIKDQQTTVTVKIYEGERALTKDNHFLGKFEVPGLTPRPPGETTIIETFTIDPNGMLVVTACEKSNQGNVKRCVITNDKNRFTAQQINRMIVAAEKYRFEDERAKEAIEARNALEFYCYKIKAKAEGEFKAILTASQFNTVVDACNETLEWIEVNKFVDKEKYQLRMVKVQALCDPIIQDSRKSSIAGESDEYRPISE